MTQYQLWLGTTGVASQNLGVYTAGQTTASSISVNVTGLPTSGATVYALLYTYVQGVWTVSYYTYTEATTAAAVSALSCTNSSMAGAGTGATTPTAGVRWDQPMLLADPLAAAQTWAGSVDAFVRRLTPAQRAAFVDSLLARLPGPEDALIPVLPNRA